MRPALRQQRRELSEECETLRGQARTHPALPPLRVRRTRLAERQPAAADGRVTQARRLRKPPRGTLGSWQVGVGESELDCLEQRSLPRACLSRTRLGPRRLGGRRLAQHLGENALTSLSRGWRLGCRPPVGRLAPAERRCLGVQSFAGGEESACARGTAARESDGGRGVQQSPPLLLHVRGRRHDHRRLHISRDDVRIPSLDAWEEGTRGWVGGEHLRLELRVPKREG